MADALSLADREDARARRLKAIEAVCVHGMNHREAAAFAGLKTSTISAMLKDERVQQYMRDLQESQAKRLDVKREQVINGLLEAIHHAKATNEPAVEIRGWEAIAKMQGYNAPDRVVHDLPDDMKKALGALREMDDKEIAQLAGQQGVIELTPGEDYHEADNG